MSARIKNNVFLICLTHVTLRIKNDCFFDSFEICGAANSLCAEFGSNVFLLDLRL